MELFAIKRHRPASVGCIVAVMMLVGCSDNVADPGPDEAAGTVEATSATDSPDLDVTLPEDEPLVATFDVIEIGSGRVVGIGDTALVAWEMVAFDTGALVESTDDFGGPVLIEVGAGMVPEALDRAIAGQTVGTQLDVEFPAGMADLPPNFDPDQAYVLAVRIVGTG